MCCSLTFVLGGCSEKSVELSGTWVDHSGNTKLGIQKLEGLYNLAGFYNTKRINGVLILNDDNSFEIKPSQGNSISGIYDSKSNSLVIGTLRLNQFDDTKLGQFCGFYKIEEPETLKDYHVFMNLDGHNKVDVRLFEMGNMNFNEIQNPANNTSSLCRGVDFILQGNVLKIKPATSKYSNSYYLKSDELSIPSKGIVEGIMCDVKVKFSKEFTLSEFNEKRQELEKSYIDN